MVVAHFDVFLVTRDPTKGSEIRKTRPGLIISPDSMNHAINTVIIAPMTTQGRSYYPTHFDCEFDGKSSQIVLDQLRTVDKTRLVKRLRHIQQTEEAQVLDVIRRLFAP